MIFKFNLRYFTIAVFLFLIEFLIACFVHDRFIRPIGGDFLVVILIYCFVRGLTTFSKNQVAAATLLFAFTIEIGQFFNLVERLGLQDVRWARIAIGTSFQWIDFVAYSLGILAVLWIERWRLGGWNADEVD